MVPDLEGTLTFDFADNAVGSSNRVVGSLEDGGNLLRNGEREDEQIYH
jgi:hypothetical protein